MSIAKEPAEYAAAWLADDAPAADEFDRAFEAQPPTAAERLAAGEALKVADASGHLPEAETLKSMSHGDLLLLRRKYKDDDKEAQNAIAPYEHRAYARESVAERPLNAVVLPLMIPAYEGAKAIGVQHGRSDPSLESIKQGLIGIGEGVSAVVRGKR